jgi:hypothetical protein
VPIYPHVPNPYASLTPAELATFGIGPSRAPASSDDDDDDKEEANDDEQLALHLLLLRVFPFWCLDAKGREDSYLYPFFILVCNGHELYV